MALTDLPISDEPIHSQRIMQSTLGPWIPIQITDSSHQENELEQELASPLERVDQGTSMPSLVHDSHHDEQESDWIDAALWNREISSTLDDTDDLSAWGWRVTRHAYHQNHRSLAHAGHAAEEELGDREEVTLEYSPSHQNEDEEGIISMEEYRRVLQLSDPVEFTIPNVAQEEPLEARLEEQMSTLVEDFENSLNRIQQIQAEIREIRLMYDHLLATEEAAGEGESEDDLTIPTINRERQQSHRSQGTDMHSHLFYDEDVPTEGITFDQLFPNTFERTFEPGIPETIDEPEEIEEAESHNFFHQLTLLDDDDLAYSDDGEREDEDFFGQHVISDTFSLPLYESHVHRVQRFQHAPRPQIFSIPRTFQSRSSRMANYYLDSNGTPCINYEQSVGRYTAPDSDDEDDFSCRDAKVPPFCRLDPNGDLECVIAPSLDKSQDDLDEIEVMVQGSNDVLETSKIGRIMRFKQMRVPWRNNDGECVGR